MCFNGCIDEIDLEGLYCLAIECASRKMNLILVALPGTQLNCFFEMLRQGYAVDSIGIEMDLSVEGNCNLVFETIKNRNLAVNMLINNVGLGSTMLFKEGNIEFYQR